MGIGLNLADIIALAKQGYKVSDVKELIALASSEDTDSAAQEQPQDEKKEEPQESVKEPTQEKEPQKSTKDHADDNAINEYKKKIEELEDKISRLQKDNVSKDNSNNPPGKSDEEILDDITRSFM